MNYQDIPDSESDNGGANGGAPGLPEDRANGRGESWLQRPNTRANARFLLERVSAEAMSNVRNTPPGSGQISGASGQGTGGAQTPENSAPTVAITPTPHRFKTSGDESCPWRQQWPHSGTL